MFAKVITALLTVTIFVFCLAASPAQGFWHKTGASQPFTLFFFWGTGCPHCAAAKPFLNRLKVKYPPLRIQSYEVFTHKENVDLLMKMAKSRGKEVLGVPVFIVGNDVISGFSKETEREIEGIIISCIEQGGCDSSVKKAMPAQKESGTVKVPFLGTISSSSLSLPVFTIVLAGMDSFNPCAFFVLFFLLGLLLHTHSRKKMVMVGATFVFFSGLIYFLFMTAWLNMFLLVGNLPVITIVAGSVALLIACINIKDFFFFKKGISLTIPEEAKPKLFERMRNLVRTGSTPTMLAGTAVLAGAANSYEFLCTAGFPMVFTRTLTLRSLPPAEYYLYLAFYNFVYIIPLSIIVIIFVTTLGSRRLSLWQGRVLKLVSGLMMLGLGMALLVKPALLNNALVSAALLILTIITAMLVIYVTKKIRPDVARQ